MAFKNITLDSVVSHSEGHVSTEIDGEAVILSIDQGNYYGMNKVLTAIWSWIEKPVSVSEICTRLTSTYQVSLKTSEADVLKILGDLSREGLIKVQ
jgi:hypothetical protein